jgi:ABC-type polysaccharide/polyol phosphate transport system ATPase subunit
MSPPIAIEARNLVKEYRIYRRPADVLWELVSRRPRHQRHRALDDVSFAIRRGEVVGIIGRNGAGKSTLLKVLTGVLDHDGGTVSIRGNVSAILELGVGLNPEYSGRENILFGCVCRGMSLREAEDKFDRIVAFAELEEVIDRPFKTYSSGMQARLLFATSIHVDAEILIVDEALAAGDALFQEKCLRHMKDLARSGRTILFVSHSIALIQQLCNRGILLHQGRILFDGDTATVLHEYDQILAHARRGEIAVALDHPTYVYGDGEQHHAELKAFIPGIDILDQDGGPTVHLEHGKRYTVRLIVVFNEDVEHAILGFRIHMPSGLVLYALQNTLRQFDIGGRKGQTLEVSFDWMCRLQAGQYILSCGVGEVLDASNGLYPAPFNEIHIRNNVKTLTVTSDAVFGGVVDFEAGIRSRVLHDAASSAARQSALV